MKYILKAKLHTLALLILAVFAIGPLLPAPTALAACSTDSPQSFTLLPPWYKGLKCTGSGSIASPADYKGGLQGFVLQIVANVIEMLFYIVGYISLAMIIWGGFKYMIWGDNQSNQVAARKTIINACIGLIISIFAVVIVNVVGGTFK